MSNEGNQNAHESAAGIWMEDIWRFLASHAFLAVGLACLLATAVFFSSGSQLAPNALLFMLAASIAACAVFAAVQKQAGGMSGAAGTTFFVFGALFFLGLYLLLAGSAKNVSGILIAGVLIGALVLLSLSYTGRLTAGRIAAIVFLLGFLLRLCYILYTTIYLRQHDTNNWDSQGHLGYIYTIYQNHTFPEGDVRNFWQAYHPPLHHILQAAWLSLLTGMGMEFQSAGESMQFLTLFYSSACMILFYKLLREFGVKGGALVAAFAVVAFHPTFIIMAGSVNNDILSITFALGAILCTVRWYRNPRVWNILKIALCVGLGMMTKLSAWMVAPGIAVVFLAVLRKNRGRLKAMIGQMAVFGAVCVPLGLWWSVRNFLRYRVPFTYIPALGLNDPQYIGSFSPFERLFAFDFTEIYHGTASLPSVYNSNPILELLKSAMFDEAVYCDIPFWPYVLFWSGLLVAVAAFLMMLAVLIRKTEAISGIMKALFAVTYTVVFVFAILFCFQFPYLCTMSMRYAVPLIVIGALFIGIFLNQTKSIQVRGKAAVAIRVLRVGIFSLIAVFCIAAAVMYCLIGVQG